VIETRTPVAAAAARPRRRRTRDSGSQFESAVGWGSGPTPLNMVRTVLCVAVVLLFAVPFLAIMIGAFDANPSTTQLRLFPRELSFESFRVAVERGILGYLVNSFVILGGGLVLQLILSILAAYALSRFRFRAAGLVLGLFLLTMMLPEEVIAVPLSQVLGELPLVGINLRGTPFGVMLPVAIWGFSILLMTEFMRDIPPEIVEAARLDGVGELRMLTAVVLPMSTPVLGVATIFGFIMIWDQYLLPLIVANGPGDYTLTVALGVLRQDPEVANGIVLVGALLALLPSLIAYLLLQKSLIRGITSGATKG